MPDQEPHFDPWRPPDNRHKTSDRRVASGTEIENALAAAERIISQANEDLRHGQTLEIAAFSLVLVTLGSVVGFVFAVLSESPARALIAAALLAAFVSLTVVALRRVGARSVRERGKLRMSIAIDLAGLVADVFLDVAQRESWSQVRIESVRLRLSSFPLGRRAEVHHLSALDSGEVKG